MGNAKKCLCCLVAVILLGGCGAPNAPLAGESSLPVTVMQEDSAAAPKAESWREQCYEEIIAALETENFNRLDYVSVDTCPDGSKVVSVIFYREEDKEKNTFWLVSPDGELTSGLTKESFPQNIKDTLAASNSNSETCYFSSEWADISKLITPSGAKEKIREFLLDTYQPDIPAGAPEWITTYMKVIHNNFHFSYVPQKQFRKDDTELQFFSIVEAPQADGTPMILTSGVLQSGLACAGYLRIEDGEVKLTPSHYEGVAVFYHDANGKVLVATSSYYNNYWYRYPHRYPLGLEKAILGTIISVEQDAEGFKGIYGTEVPQLETQGEAESLRQEKTFTTRAEAEAWAQELTNKDLEANGVALPITRFKQVDFDLPEVFSWAELEPKLIQFMCDYAKQNGQWQQ